MEQKKLDVDFKYFFVLHDAQREIMTFLLERRIDSNNLIRLHELVDYCGFNKTCSYRAIRSLHEKGWILFRQSAQIRASWVGYQEKLPAEFLARLRTSLAQAKGFPTWCDYIAEKIFSRIPGKTIYDEEIEIMRTDTNRPNEGTHTADRTTWQKKEIAATKALSRSDGSDHSSVHPRGRPRGRPHRFDPQGLPLRTTKHDTRK